MLANDLHDIYVELMFDKPDDFEVTGINRGGTVVIVTVENKQKSSKCPDCNEISKLVQSYYWRRRMDLPLLSNETWIGLKARKFYCRNKECSRKILFNYLHLP